MPLSFAFDAVLAEKGPQSLGSLLALVGLLTVSGSYVTGGEIITASGNSQAFDKLLQRQGFGRVLYVDLGRAMGAEWDNVAKKLKMYSSGGVELAAAAYPAGMTATPVPIMVMGR